MINRLYSLLEKRGEKYVENILKEDVVITEKIDTFRIIFEKRGDEFIFYKKDNTPITLVERLLSDIYEDALLEIPIITKDVHIPEGYYFGLYYTPIERPLRIPYSKLPKYILTDVTKRDGNNKIIESLDYDSVKDWAAALCVGRPPLLFQGKLTEEQIKYLIAYDTKKYDGKVMTFSEMIKDVFNASYSKEDIIEGIIIKSDDKITQIISYEFELLNEAYEKENQTRDFYDIIISDLSDYLTNYNIPILEAESKDQLYISTVCDIFNSYCDNREVNENIDDTYLTPRQFGYNGKLNKRLITNDETLKWIERAPIYEALYKVFLSSFRKTKKPYGLLSESIIEKFNGYVNLINGYVNKFEQTPLLESRSNNIVIDSLKRRTPSDIDNMRVIASIQKAFEPKIQDVKRGLEPCAVYLTTFAPFSNAQIGNVERIKNMWNCPVIIMSISSKYKVEGNNFHISDELITAQMQILTQTSHNIIRGNTLLSSWNLSEIFKYCRPKFEPIVVITDDGNKSEMALQLFFEEEIMGGRINVERNFNVGELKNEDKLAIFRAIEDNNFSLFMELTPTCIHSLMDNIFNEYRLWSGQIIKPMKD